MPARAPCARSASGSKSAARWPSGTSNRAPPPMPCGACASSSPRSPASPFIRTISPPSPRASSIATGLRGGPMSSPSPPAMTTIFMNGARTCSAIGGRCSCFPLAPPPSCPDAPIPPAPCRKSWATTTTSRCCAGSFPRRPWCSATPMTRPRFSSAAASATRPCGARPGRAPPVCSASARAPLPSGSNSAWGTAAGRASAPEARSDNVVPFGELKAGRLS